ncbi:MAG: hypothetical protein AB7N80_16120 [Bdellovibrionales bacterium]
MKHVLFTLLFAPLFALAQNVDVKGVDASSSKEGETTTIEIRKGKAAEAAKGEAQWEVTTGDADIAGETAPVAKEAKANWTKACNDWKKEFRQDNKENKVISMSCGIPDCAGDAGNKTCTSKASYKIKTRLN